MNMSLLETCKSRLLNYRRSGFDKEFIKRYYDENIYACRPRAAVLIVLLVKDNKLHVLLTQRSLKVSSHQGVVAFPGGMEEEGDETLVDTAIREANEEIGLKREQIEIIDTWEPTFVLVKNVHIATYPVVAVLTSDFEAIPNKAEVQDVFTVPLDFFLSDDSHRILKSVNKDIKLFKLKEFWVHLFSFEPAKENAVVGEGYMIWGMTALFCLKAAMIVLEELPSFEMKPYGDLATVQKELIDKLKVVNQHNSKL